ncbi:hypothetical protein [Spirillospora sp. CA-294931]|uniref:hypothetical protein n=1 Tax=Spirillospora sp. CA-294931 TaxID=3240042 RepID=UPI003D93C59F
MTTDLLKGALQRLADEAEPVDGAAERALRGMARRRRRRVAVGAVALAAAVAVPTALVQSMEPERTPVLGATKPDDDRRVVNECLRHGPVRGRMGEPRPELGKADDFRLLTRVQAGMGFVAQLGSAKGYVLCVSSAKGGNVELPTFQRWPGASGNPRSYTGNLRVDGITHLTRISANGTGSSGSGLHFTVVGRARPSVIAKVKVTFDGDRSAWAELRDGFFLAQIDAEVVREKPGVGRAPDTRVVSVDGYDASGRLKASVRQPQSFLPDDCLTKPRPPLCGG